VLSVLTPTGARPEAFARCVQLMQRQTIQTPVRWVIVDDGPEPMATPRIRDWQIIHIRPVPLWQPGENTQARNLLEGLKCCGDRVAIVEDDDDYAPWWLETVSRWLDDHDLVGEAPSIYRRLDGSKDRDMGNKRHASLCATAFKGIGVRATFEQICRQNKTMIDVKLWRACKGRIYPQQCGVIGIKGYPGRPGIGIGHRI